jgi:hypothetical protein
MNMARNLELLYTTPHYALTPLVHRWFPLRYSTAHEGTRVSGHTDTHRAHRNGQTHGTRNINETRNDDQGM